MEKTLEIKKEFALVAYDNATAKGKKLLEDLFGKNVFIKDIKEQLKTFADVLAWHGKTQEQFEKETEHSDADAVGYIKSKMIVEAYNLGEKPDYNNSNQVKYEMRWDMRSSSGSDFRLYGYVAWGTDSKCGARLVFLDKDNLYDAAEKFTAEFKEFFN